MRATAAGAEQITGKRAGAVRNTQGSGAARARGTSRNEDRRAEPW